MQDFGKDGFVLKKSKQKRKKFLNFHQNFLENEIIFAKRRVAYLFTLRPANVTSL